jgi:hypothetical protein
MMWKAASVVGAKASAPSAFFFHPWPRADLNGVSSSLRTSLPSSLKATDRTIAARQEDLEPRALVDAAGAFDPPAVLLDDTEGHGHSQTDTSRGRLRREERLALSWLAPIDHVEKLWRWCRRKPLMAGLLAAVFLVTVLGIGAFAWAFDQALRARDDAIKEKNNTADALRETENAHKQTDAERKKTALARRSGRWGASQSTIG